jgi:Putative rhamnosyl transferase
MQAGRDFQHIVITRYFVRFEADTEIKAVLAANPGWLAERFELFRAYCFPSVVAQSVKDFTWLLYFDVDTPPAELDRVRALVAGHDFIRIVLCTDFNDASREAAVRAELAPGVSCLLTTRLDNDDGWRRDFVEVLHRQVRLGRREFLNYPVGLIYYAGMTFLYRHPSNAFISLAEPAEGFLTVWCGQHERLDRIAPIRQLPAFPAFMQVVHRGTRSNKPRGVRVHRLLALVGFEAMDLPAGDETEVEDWDLTFYNMSTALGWAIRDKVLELGRRLRRR